jgi:hypothetical protein
MLLQRVKRNVIEASVYHYCGGVKDVYIASLKKRYISV